jgi:hypothetical protein
MKTKINKNKCMSSEELDDVIQTNDPAVFSVRAPGKNWLIVHRTSEGKFALIESVPEGFVIRDVYDDAEQACLAAWDLATDDYAGGVINVFPEDGLRYIEAKYGVKNDQS